MKSYLICAFALIFLTAMRDDDTVPPRAPGLWEVRITTPATDFRNVHLPAHTMINKFCVQPGDPRPTRSPEMSNLLAQMVSCWNKRTTRSGTKYIVEEDYMNSKETYVSRHIYDGDFTHQLTARWSTIKNGAESELFYLDEHRIGNCTAQN